MKVNVDELEVRNNTEKNRYEIVIDDYTAELDYRIQGNTITFSHTGVPSDLEGEGVGSKLVQHALDEALEKKRQVRPLCPFVKYYINEHPEYQKLLK